MILRFRAISIQLAVVIAVSLLAVVFVPRFASAEAGAGGGGGGDGCSYNYSTCYGAVWRYYQSSSNSYGIRNIDGSYTYATGCASSGGFFAYVLVNKNAPSDPSQVRSWKIGPADGLSGNRSMFFGGWTNYTKYSDPNDKAPTNPTSGDYSWYAAKDAFAITSARGQGNGFTWDGGSLLGWFCYQGLDFTLTPTITGTPSSTEGSSPVTLTPTVTNSGSTASSPVQWQVTSFRVVPGGTVPSAATNGQLPVDYYKTGTKDAATASSGTGQTFPRNTSSLSDINQTIGDYDVGTKICYGFSVQPYSNLSGDWRHSTPFCVSIAKRPKVQVLGSDLIVGQSFTGATSTASNIVTSSTVKTISGENKTFGSWAEYGVISSGSVSGIGAGSAYAGGLKNATTCGVNLLTFSNTNGTSCSAKTKLGYYSSAKAIPDVSTAFPVTSTTPVFTSLADSTRRRVERVTGDISIGNATIQKGDWLVINASGNTVEINDDIKYTTDTLKSVAEIPQLVIIADKINIKSNVQRIDAWLIASGTNGVIDTCSDVAISTKLTSKLCDKTLRVNGPAIAKSLLLRRTAGSGPGAATGDPAETFNTRPDAYLWSVGRAISANRVQTVYSRELPPRF